jgi:hypothetical protein
MVLMLFHTAFMRGLIFTIATSLTRDNDVEGLAWAGIHHKTSKTGGQTK